MKKIFLLIPISFWASCGFTQKVSNHSNATNSIEFSWVRNLLDKNLTLEYDRRWEQSSLHAGIKFYLWTPILDDQGYAFKNRGYADNFGQKFGMDLGYRYFFLRKKKEILAKPFLFLNTQISRFALKYKAYIPNGYIHTTNPPGSYQAIVLIEGQENPFFSFQTTAGAGFELPLSKKFFLVNELGMGLMVIPEKPSKLHIYTSSPFLWEYIAPYYRIGIQYKL